MNQADIDELHRLVGEKHDEIERHAKNMSEITGGIRAIRDRCDHRLPDGRSALEGGFMMRQCIICYWNDL